MWVLRHFWDCEQDFDAKLAPSLARLPRLFGRPSPITNPSLCFQHFWLKWRLFWIVWPLRSQRQLPLLPFWNKLSITRFCYLSDRVTEYESINRVFLANSKERSCRSPYDRLPMQPCLGRISQSSDKRAVQIRYSPFLCLVTWHTQLRSQGTRLFGMLLSLSMTSRWKHFWK